MTSSIKYCTTWSQYSRCSDTASKGTPVTHQLCVRHDLFICAKTYSYAHTCTYTYTQTRTHIHRHARSCMHAHAHARTRTRTHTHSHTHSHAHAHAHTHAHAHAHNPQSCRLTTTRPRKTQRHNLNPSLPTKHSASLPPMGIHPMFVRGIGCQKANSCGTYI